MNTGLPSWEQLNAYVDGELSVADAAEVARALADDKSLAEAVATLSRLKAATHEGIEPFILASSQPESIHPALRLWRWRQVAIAASIAAVLIVAAVASLVPWMNSAAPPPWLPEAWQVHEQWAQTVTTNSPTPVDSGLVLAAMNEIGPDTYLPDLSDARLTLSHLDIVTLANTRGEALHVGYLGNRGCQISLIIIPKSGDMSADLMRYDQGARRGYAWRGGQRDYALLAEGMDKARLALLAETLHRATVQRRPFDAETRTALRESRERSAPCLS